MFLARIARRTRQCRDHFLVALAVEDFPKATPGQFLQVMCREPDCEYGAAQQAPLRESDGTSRACAAGQGGPLLRRPFSVAGLRRSPQGCEIDLLGRAVGPGTTWLAKQAIGQAVDIVGPLGRGFSAPTPNHQALLVAGGVGLAPIIWLAEELTLSGVHCAAACGARTRELIAITLVREPSADEPTLCAEEFARWGIATLIATDDGSCGMKGSVVDGMRRCFEAVGGAANTAVFACGPAPMLRATASFCAEHGLPCQVAMERMMGCGMGTCQSCVVPVRDDRVEDGWRYALCCTEGPVFDAADVVWANVV